MAVTVETVMNYLEVIKKQERKVRDLIQSIKDIEEAELANKTRMEVVVDGEWKKVVPIATCFIIEAYNKQLENEYSSYLNHIKELQRVGVDVKIDDDFDKDSSFRDKINKTMVILPR